MNMAFLRVGNLILGINCMIILLSLTRLVKTKCAFESYPKKLLECYRTYGNMTHANECPGTLINDVCINQFLWETCKERWQPDIKEENTKYLQRLFLNPPRQSAPGDGHRVKRQGNRRIRAEYRDLTFTERMRFHNALNAMKRNRTMVPNVYDALVSYHSGAVSRSAHGGPNFLGWHRVYLYLFENALLNQDPRVIFPYWDCTLDYELGDMIRESYFFSEHFAGGSSGSVLTGPFRDWGITRNGNARRRVLIGRRNIQDVLSRYFHRDIFSRSSRYSIESLHNRIHMFIGGDMARLETAAKDPVFFMLHNYVDYIWERFRENQRRNNINSEFDYPFEAGTHPPSHGPFNNMEAFEHTITNIQGYSNHWTSEIYTFKESPRCPSCNGSPWLECINNYCRAKHTFQRVTETPRRRRSAGNNGNNDDILEVRNRKIRRRRSGSTDDSRNSGDSSGSSDSSGGYGDGSGKSSDSSGGYVDGSDKSSESSGGYGDGNGKRSDGNGGYGDGSSKGSDGSDGYGNGSGKSSDSSGGYGNTGSGSSDSSGGSSDGSGGYGDGSSESSDGSGGYSDSSSGSSDGSGSYDDNSSGSSDSSGGYGDSSSRSSDSSSGSVSSGSSDESGERREHTLHAKCPLYDERVQNTFCLNGKANTDDWSFMAVEVVYKRPPGMRFKTYKIREGRPDINTDIFDGHIQRKHSKLLKSCRRSGSGFVKVFVTADGLSYEGNSIEYAIVDERLPVSTGYAFVPIKPPTKEEETVVLLTAADECGQLCYAICRDDSSQSGFKPCSGVMRLSAAEKAGLYSKSIAEEAQHVLHSEDFKCSHTNEDGKRCMKFVCDSDEVYPWDKIVNA